MPLHLIAPRKGKTPFWSVRGTYMGVKLDRSTKTASRATAAGLLRKWKEEIERGSISKPGEPTLLDVAVNYMHATGNERFMQRVLDDIGHLPPRAITQQVVDDLALRLYPTGSPATRNRQVYTVVSSLLKQAGMDSPLKRPKGWRGSQRTDWLQPEQAFRLFRNAGEIDPEFQIFLVTLCYTGLRLSEGLGLTCDRVNLGESFAYVGRTKNGLPRAVHLPPVIVAALANHPRGMERQGRVFRFTKCGRLYALLRTAKERTGPDVSFCTFHTFRHSWATWMRRYAGLDTTGLLATQAWKDAASARRYEHVVATEEARKADLLPVENVWKTSKQRAKPKRCAW